MKNKNNLSIYMLASVFIVVGVLLALDWLGINLFGLKGSWFAFLLLLCSLALAIGQLIMKSKKYIFSPTFLGIMGGMLFIISATDLGISTLWPMIPLSVSLGLLLASLLRDKVKILTELGFIGTILSVAFLIGGLFSLWHIVFPLVLVLGGIVIIFRTALKKKEEKYEIPSISIEERVEEKLKERENEAFSSK